MTSTRRKKTQSGDF